MMNKVFDKATKGLYHDVPWSKGSVILLAYAGSIAYGTNTPASDVDFRGIVIPPERYILGLDNFESYHSPEGSRDQEDIVVYSLKKYVNLALQNNPNVLEMLWTDPSHFVYINRFGRELVRNRDIFLSKRTFKTFSGYALAQIHRMTQNGGKPTHGAGNPERQAIREKLGYDPKAASHLVRLMRMGLEILRDGRIEVLRHDAAELLEIKQGKYALEDIVAKHDELYQEMLYWREHTPLPEDPDYEAANDLVIRLTKEFLKWKR